MHSPWKHEVTFRLWQGLAGHSTHCTAELNDEQRCDVVIPERSTASNKTRQIETPSTPPGQMIPLADTECSVPYDNTRKHNRTWDMDTFTSAKRQRQTVSFPNIKGFESSSDTNTVTFINSGLMNGDVR